MCVITLLRERGQVVNITISANTRKLNNQYSILDRARHTTSSTWQSYVGLFYFLFDELFLCLFLRARLSINTQQSLSLSLSLFLSLSLSLSFSLSLSLSVKGDSEESFSQTSTVLLLTRGHSVLRIPPPRHILIICCLHSSGSSVDSLIWISPKF